MEKSLLVLYECMGRVFFFLFHFGRFSVLVLQNYNITKGINVYLNNIRIEVWVYIY